jgi:DNA-damage-inducible protein J
LDGVDVLRDTMYLSEVQIVPTTMVHVRVDKKTKQNAAKTLAGMGISVSDAVRMLLVRVAAEKALLFEVRVPNATTVKAMRAADKGKGKRSRSSDGLFKDLGI